MLRVCLLLVFAMTAFGGASGLIEGNVGQFVTQIVGILGAGAYAAVVTVILVLVLNATMGFRVDDEEEQIGLDQVEHGEVGYNL